MHVKFFALTLALVLLATPAQAEGKKMPITTSSPQALGLYRQAQVFLDQSRPVKAKPLLEQALELDPDFIMALHLIRSTAGTFSEGREMTARFDEKYPSANMSDGERAYFEALAKVRAGDRGGYIADLQDLVATYPADERLLFQYASTFYGTDKARAVELFERVAHIAPSFIPVHNTLGYAHKDSGNMERAEQSFEKAIELDPENPNGYDSYGELLLKLGRFQESIAQYDKALALEPLFPSSQIGVASNLCLLGEHDEARARLRSLFDIAPHDGIRSGIHWAMAVTYADEGELETSLDELEKNYMISQKNEDATAMRVDKFNMAKVLLEMGRVDDAEAAATAAIAIARSDDGVNPRSLAFQEAFYIWWESTVALARLDLHTASQKMESFFSTAAGLGNANFTKNGYDLSGRIQLARGQHAKALESFAQGNQHDPYIMYYRGMAHLGLGQITQANAMFDHVIHANSPLDFTYSFARKRAAAKRSQDRGK